MALQPVPSCSRQPAESELYFLIAQFLSKGPCGKSAQMLIQELNENNLLPNRLDWEGTEHTRTYDEMVSSNMSVTGDHLLRICQGLTYFVDKNAPVPVSRSSSLLGIVNKPVCTEKGYRNSQWSHQTFATLQRGRPPEVPVTKRRPASIVNVHHGKHLTGAVSFNSAFPVTMYQQIKMHKRILGHLSSVYCVAFDRTGQRIITGSDDCLVKIWSALDGRLLATLRGHSAEISELTVNYENTLIAAASCEKIIRVWSLRTCAPIAVLQGHSGAVTSLLFSPLAKGSTRYLVSTGGDGAVCLWQWDVDTLQFKDRSQKFMEKSGPGAQMLCSSCSAGGMFLAVGGSDHAIRLYYFGNEVPEKVSELEGHTDIVDSILFSYNSERFVSGSKDGIARIWRLEEQEWQSIVLDMDTNLDDRLHSNNVSYAKPKVLMIAWDTTDNYVVTASSAHLLKVWDSHTGKLLHVLMGHENDIYVLEPHPFDSRMMLSAGHDGNIFIWDIKNGSKVMHCFNLIAGQGHGAILDCKLSADGQRIAGTDSHGYLLIFGFGDCKSYEKIPEQMFFHTDYRPLIVDAHHFVLDEQTQQAPHLMPPPFLVDVDGNPHPPTYQRLVPGRENCADEHLVPQLGYMETVDGEIVEQVVSQQTNSDQQNQDPSLRPEQRPNPEQEPGSSTEATNAARRVLDLASPPNIGLRRSGQVEGVRQMHNNSPRSQIATERDLIAWRKRVVVPEIPSIVYRKEEDTRIAKGEQEKLFFVNQKPHGLCDYSQGDNFRARILRQRKKLASRMRTSRQEIEEFLELSCEEDDGTRSSAEEEEEQEDEVENQTENSAESASEDEDDWRNTSDISSEYSDWQADAGINLQPPSRNSTRRRVQRLASSSEEESSAEEIVRSTEEKSTPKKERPKKTIKDEETTRLPERVPLNREISNDWRPSNWITDTTPRRSPFVPQMGDEVMYFRQGHEAYINAVQRSNLIIANSLKEPWKKCVLRDQELVKIVGIRYEIGPPTLCCLKLALIDHVSGKITEQSFSLKYHDMPDVIDFLVLRQFFDHARRTDWQAGDRFRSIIDDAWWFGTVVCQEPYQADYPDSLFQCYTVKWDNGEIEKLSPWDMDVIPDEVLPPEVPGTSISITEEERDTLLYCSQEGEWGKGDLDSECERIICGIDQFLNLDWTGPFSAPVDLSAYPSYCMMISYPTDLSTIRMRLVNRFYRRVSALIWEVRCIEHNARTFNEPGSSITKSAKKITDQLLKFIMDNTCCSITDLCTSPEASTEGEETGDGQSENNTNSWKSRCMALVDFIIECEDSEPFREPVDLEQFPDYKDIIETPMDFGTIKETLASESYSSPYDLCRDMRLVFLNAKLYTPNKRSRIYGMVLRLSALMEERMKGILYEYRVAQSRMRSADWPSTKREHVKDAQRERRSQSVVYRKVRQARACTSDEMNQPFLEMSSPQPTSSGVARSPSPLSVASSSRQLNGQSPVFSPASFTRSHASSREQDSSASSSRSSGSESDSSSSTSASEHSSSSSSSSSSERNDKTDSSSASHKVNGVKSKMTNGRQQRTPASKQASQGNNQRRIASSKRRISSSSETDSESAAKIHQGMRKKTLRKCAALAANKIKNMSDVENSTSTSDSDCSASKNSRTLPQRTAAERAKKRLLHNSEEEIGLRSDSEREHPTPIAPKSQSPECRVVLTNVCPTGTFGGRLLPQVRNGEVSDTESEHESPERKRQKKVASPPRVRKQRLISDSDSLVSSSAECSPPRNGVSSDEESSLSDDSEDVRTNGAMAGRSRGHDQKRKRIVSSCDEDWEEEDSGRAHKLTRRSKIRTRNQGKRTVRYDENQAQSDENVNGAQSQAARIPRLSVREKARQFLR